jgi:hypothetical protein
MLRILLDVGRGVGGGESLGFVSTSPADLGQRADLVGCRARIDPKGSSGGAGLILFSFTHIDSISLPPNLARESERARFNGPTHIKVKCSKIFAVSVTSL